MYEILFYEDNNNYSDLVEYLTMLSERVEKSKEDRIKLKQITLYIELLKQYGRSLHTKIAKHIVDDIWELRPGNIRILFFYWKDNKYVLLNFFKKDTQKTPKREIKKAQNRMNDFLERNK